jgi:hypothetical protein
MNMLNEKQNNTHPWIHSLDVPENLPVEEMIDKNAAWKILYQRLIEKPRKNKMIMYWAAAACLLIAFSLPIIIVKRIGNRIVRDVSQKNKNHAQSTLNYSSTRVGTDPTVENVTPIGRKKDSPLIIKRIFNNLHIDNDAVKQILPRAIIKNENVTPQELTANISTFIDTTSSLIAAVVPVKKKLRVVHINEVENDANAIPLSEPDRQQSAFSLTIGSNNQHIKQPTSDTRDYAGVFKIKISSKN